MIKICENERCLYFFRHKDERNCGSKKEQFSKKDMCFAFIDKKTCTPVFPTNEPVQIDSWVIIVDEVFND